MKRDCVVNIVRIVLGLILLTTFLWCAVPTPPGTTIETPTLRPSDYHRLMYTPYATYTPYAPLTPRPGNTPTETPHPVLETTEGTTLSDNARIGQLDVEYPILMSPGSSDTVIASIYIPPLLASLALVSIERVVTFGAS